MLLCRLLYLSVSSLCPDYACQGRPDLCESIHTHSGDSGCRARLNLAMAEVYFSVNGCQDYQDQVTHGCCFWATCRYCDSLGTAHPPESVGQIIQRQVTEPQGRRSSICPASTAGAAGCVRAEQLVCAARCRWQQCQA